MDRGGLRRVGKAYPGALLDLAGDLFAHVFLSRHGAADLYPAVAVHAERTLRRVLKNTPMGRLFKNVQMQGAQKANREAYMNIR